MMKTLNIRATVVSSLESEAMSEDLYSQQVAEHASESVLLDKEIEDEIEEDSSVVASLEHRIEMLQTLSGIAGKPISSMEQIQLGLAVGYGALHNTDLNVHEDILGVSKSSFQSSFESSGTVTFSSESIGQSIKDMASKAGEKIAQAGRWLLELVKKIINLFSGKEKRVKNLKAMIEEAKKNSNNVKDVKIRLTGSQTQNIGTVDDFILLTSRFEKITGANDKYIAVCNAAEECLKTIKKQSTTTLGMAFFFGPNAKNLTESIEKVHQFYFETFGATLSRGDETNTKIGKTNFIGRRQLVFTVGDMSQVDKKEGEEAQAAATQHILKTFKMVIEKDEKDESKELKVEVMSLSDLDHLVTALEKAVAGKLLDLSRIEKYAAHSMWNLAMLKDSDNVTELRVVVGAVNRSIVQPQGRFMSVYQSVLDDYLRFGERSAKVHVKGKDVEASEGTGLATV